MESRVRSIAREIANGLKAGENTQGIIKWLHAANCLVTKTENGKLPFALLHCDDIPFRQLSIIYREQHFASLCRTILDLLSVEWLQKLPGNYFREHVEVLFITGPATDALLALDHAMEKHRHGFKLQKISRLLETFIEKGRLQEVVLAQLQLWLSADGRQQQAVMSSHGGLWEELISTLVAIPSKMANRLGKETSDVFLPCNYVPHLAKAILECLQEAHDLTVNSKECSLTFLCRLIGKLCFTGNADLLLEVLVPVLCSSVTGDAVWSQVCVQVITGIPSATMESFLVPFLSKVPWFKLVEKLLGDSVVHNQHMKFLLCTKLLFHRYFSQVLLLQNVIGYLASSPTRRHLYSEVFANLLRVWGEASNLRHVSTEQHLFLCRCLLLCVSHVEVGDDKQWSEGLLRLLLPAVPNHLGSSDADIRLRGMLVAQVLTKRLDPTGPQIEFEITRTEEVEELEKLLVVPPDPGMEHIHKAVEDLKLSEPKAAEQTEPVDDREDLDSDDDLVPYDMSNDKLLEKVKAPRYLRDCMEGLLNSEEVEKFEASLAVAETLIRKQPDGLSEIAAELTKILLHSTESRGIVDFNRQRFCTMVALAVHSPEQVAQYLTSQFYERDYNIRQRLDILEVLTAAAQELSQPGQPKTQKGKSRENPARDIKSHATQPETWQEVVQRRIDSKTRRFGKGASQPPPEATPNRFASVAGHFFFPLMTSYDRGERHFDLLGEDSMVLQRLVYSLAIILYSAIHTPVSKKMGKILLEFTWSLRVHQDVQVRQAVLLATSIILLVLPSHCLMTELQADLIDTKAWLERVLEKEVNRQCQELASQALSVLESLIAKEMQKSMADAVS